MWSLPWSSWVPWSGQDKEPEEVEVKEQTKAGGGQRSHRGVKYYQRSRYEEGSPIAGETVGMDKGKLKPLGGAKRASGNQQQGDGAELDDGWRVVHEEYTQAAGEEVDKSWRDMVDELEFTPHKPKVETGKDLQTLEARVDRYRQERNEARSEVRALQKQLEQSKTEAEKCSGLTMHYEGRIQELEAIVADAHRKHEAQLDQLKKEFEGVLTTQKTEGYREANAHARTFREDRSSSVQQIEATYQAQLYQKEKELRDKENDFARRQNHYLTQISQLEAACNVATRREGEARREVERIKMEHHSQLHRLPVPHAQTGDGVPKVIMEGRPQGFVKLEDVQRALSKEPIEVSQAELASLGARERRSVQKKIQQLQVEVDLKDNEIETLSNQLEQKGQRIEVLSKVLEQTQQTTKRGLRHTNEDSYLENLTKMTEQLSTYEISDRAQKNELVKLHAKVKEAETVTEQLDGAIQQMEELETENRMLKEQIARQGGGGAREQQHGREVTYQSYNQEVMAELSHFRPFKQEVQRLQKDLEEAKSFQKDAVFHHSRVITLTAKLSEVEEENRRVRGEYHDLEGSHKVLENEMVELQQLLREKDAKIAAISRQLQMFEKTATDLMKIVEHTKGQSRIVKDLRQELARKEGELKKKDNLTAAKESVQDELERLQKSCTGKETVLIATRHENDRLKKEIEQLCGRNAQLDFQLRQVQELAQSRRDATQLTTEVEQLRKEKADLVGELETHKVMAQTFQEDFQQERKDRMKAHSQVAEIEARYQHQLQSMVEQLDRTTQELDRTKKDAGIRIQQELEQSQRNVTHLRTEVEQLRREKADNLKQLAEKDELLQAAQDEQLQFRQQKDRIIQTLQGEKGMLRRQVSLLGEQLEKLQPQKAQQTHRSEFWEVSRGQIHLNMQKMLGTGAWGFVVEGTFRGQQVAVKCLHDMIRSPKFVEVMRKEIGIMAQVRHPNLVLLIAAVMDTENDPLIVTELLDISLRKAYEKKCLQGSSRLSIFRDIAAALNYLHLHQSGEIIHRDVSSANVLLEAKPNNQWKAKLSDFGSAKLAIEAKSTAPGAPVYSAPEVRKEMGIPQTPKLDVYSYGILLCEVTEEQFPDEESLPSMIQAVQGKWAFMHRLISSCVQYHPDRRPTMSYVLGEFNKLRPQK